MKMLRAGLGLIVGVLLLGGTAGAATTTVQQIVDYTYNIWNIEDGIWFIPADEVLDHWPYHRISDEDWGWTHSPTGLVPADANGIASATLTIVAWGVDSPDWSEEFDKPGEQDVIYADGVNLGLLDSYLVSPTPDIPWNYAGQPGGVFAANYWSTTVFDLPAEVLETLWTADELYMWIDIDKLRSGGHRVTLHSSTLTIRYITSGEVPEEPPVPGELAPVHRFWSGSLMSHFYTAKETEKQKLVDNYDYVWTYEGPVYQVFLDDTQPDTLPVYRFWSDLNDAHFYTISESEKDKLVNEFADVWAFEGPVFYAHPVGLEPAEALPVHRFWSDSLMRHFYTISESEKQKIMDNFSDVWGYEGIAWYAYAP